MGSWNKTCGISNLHIREGDSAYLFVLQQQTDHSERCHTNSLFRPTLLPVSCNYDDYGRAYNLDKNMDYIFSGIAERLVEMPMGENHWHDIAISKDSFDVETFFNAVHEGRLFTNEVSLSGKSPIDFVMFRKDIVDAILKNYVIDAFPLSGTTTFQQIINDVPRLIEFLSNVEKYVKDGTVIFTESTSDSDEAKSLTLWSLLSNPLSKSLIPDQFQNNLALRYLFRGSVHYYRSGDLVDVNKLITHAIVSKDILEATRLIESALIGIFIDLFMESTRKIWVPGCHEGSQNDELAGYIVLNDAILDAIDLELQQLKEEYDYDYNDDDDE